MKSRAVCSVFLLLLASNVSNADDWPGFRGNTRGIAPNQDLPTQLNKDNLLWTMKMPGVGTSSPIVLGDKIFLTAYTGYGTAISSGFFGGPKGDDGPKKDFPKKDFPKKEFGKGDFGGFGKGGPPDAAQKNLKLLVVCVDGNKGEILWQKEVDPKLPETNFSGMIREHGYASNTPVADADGVFAFFGKSGAIGFDLKGN